MKAAIAGATGLIGTQLLKLLDRSRSIDKVEVFSRKPIRGLSKKSWYHIIDFDKLPESGPKRNIDVAFCCLGTTMKQAGSKEAFRLVDQVYVFNFAKWALDHGAQHFLLVSSMGANPRSSVFYNKVKGEVEDEISSLDFYSTSIFRPSLLLGNRKQKRGGEQFAQKLSRVINPLIPAKYKGIEDKCVARAMMQVAQNETQGERIILNDEILKLGK